MKRLLLLAVLSTGSVIGQDTLILKNGRQHQVRFIEIRGNSAVVEIQAIGPFAASAEQFVLLKLIDRIILEDGTVVWAAADSRGRATVLPDSIQSATTKPYSAPQPEGASVSFTVRNLGILLIAGSGVLGYINNNKECDPCNDIEDVENFADDLKSRANLQYGSLILGALLMLIGGDMILVVPGAE